MATTTMDWPRLPCSGTDMTLSQQHHTDLGMDDDDITERNEKLTNEATHLPIPAGSKISIRSNVKYEAKWSWPSGFRRLHILAVRRTNNSKINWKPETGSMVGAWTGISTTVPVPHVICHIAWGEATVAVQEERKAQQSRCSNWQILVVPWISLNIRLACC